MFRDHTQNMAAETHVVKHLVVDAGGFIRNAPVRVRRYSVDIPLLVLGLLTWYNYGL